MQECYIAIDLKSFYASVECAERGLDPLKTNLVVADAARTEKTICLAVSPSLKKYGIPGRPRLFEVVQRVREVNAARKAAAPGGCFAGKSYLEEELEQNPSLEADYIVAPPRMARYMEYSSKIYQIYLNYVAPEDIHVYSVDEVFMDVTHYLKTYQMTAEELARKMILEVLAETKITATAGIGTNLYLAKVAMDIEAKRSAPDENGVRIAQLDEKSYREKLWLHTPLTDFWRVGRGYRKKLEQYGMRTMGDVARCSLGGEGDIHNEDLLYRLFGVNAELLIDHAWGFEPCKIKDIKAYQPESASLSLGQVLQQPYGFEKGRLIVREMTDLLVLDLVEKRLVTNQMVLTVGYDVENLKNKEKSAAYRGEVTTDRYGRRLPKAAHGTENIPVYTSSTEKIMDAVLRLYDRIVDPAFSIRRVYVVACRLLTEEQAKEKERFVQMDLFADLGLTVQEEKPRANAGAAAGAQATEVSGKPAANAQAAEVPAKAANEETARPGAAREAAKRKAAIDEEKERKLQEVMLSVKKKYGKNAIIKGMNLQEGATTIDRNRQIGGHKA